MPQDRSAPAAARAVPAPGDAPTIVRTDPRGDRDAPLARDSGAAFFDLDNTMMVGASMYYFARGLAARKFVTGRDLARFAWRQARFRIGGRENHDHMVKARGAALAFVAGRSVADIVAVSEEIYDELMAGRIWAGTQAVAESHLAAGRPVWLATAAPVELATVVAERLGLTGALGTVADNLDGVYTGTLVGAPLHGPAKADAIRALAAREGYLLENSHAYSDSINDLPMLSLVGHPVAVNPDPSLRNHARDHGWPVVDFRGSRRAARVAVPASVAATGAAGVVTGAALIHRHRARRHRAIDLIPRRGQRRRAGRKESGQKKAVRRLLR